MNYLNIEGGVYMYFYINVTKGLNTSKLVKKPISVQNSKGKIFTRMQWVDPLTGEPVNNGKKANKPVEHWSTEGIKQTSDRNITPYLTIENNKLQPSQVISKPVPDVADKRIVPDSVIKGEVNKLDSYYNNDYSDIMDMCSTKNVKVNKLSNTRTVFAPMSIKHIDNINLPTSEIEKRCGVTGDLDSSLFTKGTPVLEAFSDDIRQSYDLIDSYPFTKGTKINVEEHFSNIFKNTTKEGLEYAFSGDNFKAKMTSISVFGNAPTNKVHCEITFDFADPKSGDYMGTTIRSAYRDDSGLLHVYNNLLDIESKYQNKGISKQLLKNNNQLWRYLSDGHPFHDCLAADINVGVYSWANKGYDFSTKKDLDTARNQLQKFAKEHGIDLNKTLKNCGYNSLKELQHSWQFSCLKDGNTYDLGDLEDEQISGNAHLGKAFMLSSMPEWGGRAIFNTGSIGEKIFEKSVGI